jgi:hypothetical protein
VFFGVSPAMPVLVPISMQPQSADIKGVFFICTTRYVIFCIVQMVGGELSETDMFEPIALFLEVESAQIKFLLFWRFIEQ